jgi:hypothetical protein
MSEQTMMNKIWDKVGICASGLCLVHCIATPALLLAFPASTMSFLGAELVHEIHEIFAVIVVASILIAVYPTCRKHGHKDIITIALAGVSLVLSAVFMHDLMSENVSHGLTVLGSIFLIWAHVRNMKVRHGKCTSKSHSHS